MPYQKRTDGDKIVFTVTPDPAPSLLKFAFLPMLIPTIVLFLLNIVWGLIAVAVLGLWMAFRQNHKTVMGYRKPAEFTVAPIGLQANGQFYESNDIQRIVMRNNVPDLNIVLVGNPPPGWGAGNGFRNALVRVSCRVDMESNGNVVVLAGGLKEAAAYGILVDVAKILGRQVS